jgi:hypothetical protein
VIGSPARMREFHSEDLLHMEMQRNRATAIECRRDLFERIGHVVRTSADRRADYRMEDGVLSSRGARPTYGLSGRACLAASSMVRAFSAGAMPS